jgi:O-acetyl-ADP-ribose deacetylase (regulator of RNase III)
MPFNIIHNDITKMNTDAIVNAANSNLLQGGGVCGAIFQAAGAELLQKECSSMGVCPVGSAVITKGYHLPAKFVIHAVGPIWRGGKQGEAELLAKAYRSSLELAKEYRLASISFPLISSGIYGYPKEEALHIAMSAVSEFLRYHEMDIYLVVFDREAISIGETLFKEINHYMEAYYDEGEDHKARRQSRRNQHEFQQIFEADILGDGDFKEFPVQSGAYEAAESQSAPGCIPRSLDDLVKNMEETFSEMTLRLIDEKGKTDVEVYKKANIDRKLFSKIRSNKNYQPKKNTAIALAISLELSLDETKDLLMKAGYTLSMSNRFDVIIRYFIEHKSYDMFRINEVLFAYEQPLLGA